MKGRVDFRKGTFDDMIDKKGLDLKVFHAMRCPCGNPDTGQPDPNCPNCVRGWQYYGEESIKGVCTSLAAEKQFVEAGGLLLGSMNLTVKAEVNLGYHDRIIHEDSVINFSELILHDENYETDSLRYAPIEVIRCVGRDGSLYQKDTDFTLNGTSLAWIDSQLKPETNEYFSIAYQTHPIWLVLQHIHIVRDTFIKFKNPVPQHNKLPIQTLCRLEWLHEE